MIVAAEKCWDSTKSLVGLSLQVFQCNSSTNKMSLSFYVTHILPVGLPMALSMQFGNTAYLFLSVSFIEMLKVR